jgi:hypothetical protein
MLEKEKPQRIPYRERRAVKKFLVPRTLKLKRRKLRNRLLFFFAILTAYFGWQLLGNVFLNGEEAQPTKIRLTTRVTKQETTATIDLAQSPVFMYVLKNGRIGQAAIVAFDKKSSTLTLIFFEATYHLPMLGLGVIDIHSLTADFADEYFCSLKNTFSFPLVGPFRLTKDVLKPDLINSSPNLLLLEMKKSGIKLAGNLKAKGVDVVPAPTRLSKVGKKTVIVIDTAKLNEAANIMFSDNIPKKKIKAKAVILNGSGKPAAGTAAAVKLIKANFQVRAVRNAESFNYLTTKIKVADENLGKEIARVLNCGEVEITREVSDIADALIIIGKDFRDSI